MSTRALIRQVDVNSIWFERILALRAQSYGRTEAGIKDDLDSYSLHFAAVIDDRVVSALRVTCRRDGRLESEEHYPKWILASFDRQICAASRVCTASPSTPMLRPLPAQLAGYGWTVILALGVRIDVTKARIEAIPYYLRMGYLFVRNSCFYFAKHDVVCGLIAYPADPNHNGRFATLFADTDMPCHLASTEFSDRFTSSRREIVREFLEFKKQLTCHNQEEAI